LFRGEHGTWLCGFSKYIVDCNACVVELWEVYESLKIARDRGYYRVKLNVDSKNFVGNGKCVWLEIDTKDKEYVSYGLENQSLALLP
jgi:hypothetical protein